MSQNTTTPSRTPKERLWSQHRPIEIKTHFTKYAEGSVLISFGNTVVLCNATVEEQLPSWLKEKGQGWVTAEYNMLPRSTHTRTRRERDKVSGRTQEIQRLISRALRSCVDLKTLGERQITVDCDVLQADGGTRTTSINGGCLALGLAIKKLESLGKLPVGAFKQKVFKDTVAAVSVGLKNGQVLVDLDYPEDSSCDVDMNFVVTGQGQFVEIQGTGENRTFSQDEMTKMTVAAQEALTEITRLQRTYLYQE